MMTKFLMPLLLSLSLLLALAGCTDAGWGKITSLGNKAHVTCYSGGKMIYEGASTGKVKSEASSDGYYFKDAKTGKIMEVSGNCIILYD